MTRKDYIAIANAFAETRSYILDGRLGSSDPMKMNDLLMQKMIKVLRNDNDRFDADGFRAACKVRLS